MLVVNGRIWGYGGFGGMIAELTFYALTVLSFAVGIWFSVGFLLP
jgi:hypothetical protein